MHISVTKSIAIVSFRKKFLKSVFVSTLCLELKRSPPKALLFDSLIDLYIASSPTIIVMWKSILVLWAVALSLVHGGRILDEERVRTDLIRLIPFSVQLATTGSVDDINVYAVTDIVTDWMTASFVVKSGNTALMGNATTFESLGLEVQTRRHLDEEASAIPIQLFTIAFEGVSLWERRGSGTTPMNAEIVELIQRATFLEDNQLLPLLRAAEPFTGLGDVVVDVRAYVTSATEAPEEDEKSDNLEIIIIIAIVVACLAFALLMFAVVWAWRSDQSKQDTYSKGDRNAARMDVPTGSEESDNSPTGMTPPAVEDPRSYNYDVRPPAEIGSSNNDYPDSVISEDISTSLTAYYRSGMAGYSNAGGNRETREPRELNDAASMSSMDSYGYSLDGYAPSLGPAPQGYPVGPFNGMVKDPDTDYSEDEGTTFTKDDENQ